MFWYRCSFVPVSCERGLIGLSLFSSFLQVIEKATENLRNKIYIGDICHSTTLGQLTRETTYHRRLAIDENIQLTLYENTAFVLSQAHLVLYWSTSFDENKLSIKHILIGLGINFFTNFLLILVHIHWHGIQVLKVWFKHYKLHVLSNAMAVAMTIWYFTGVLLTVFEPHTTCTLSLYKNMTKYKTLCKMSTNSTWSVYNLTENCTFLRYKIKNCTAPM